MDKETKAPMPDEVKDAIYQFRQTAKEFGINDLDWFTSWKTIRAHIAAQAEKIDKLEDENKRLREALLAMLDCPSFLDQKTVPPGTDANGSPHTAVVNMSVSWLKISMARAALAQTEGEKHE